MIRLTRVDICYKIELCGRVFLPERSEVKRYVCEQRRMRMMRMRSWGFSFTVIDGRRNDGRVSLRIGEEMKDLDGMMEVSDGKMGT